MTVTVTFEKAGVCDAENVFRLCKENIDRYEDVSSIEYDKVIDWVDRKIKKYIDGYTRIYADGELCGYFRFCKDGDMYELDDFYLFEGYRGRGIGTRVLSDILSRADADVYLYVFRRNGAAVRIYEKYGFEVSEDLGTRYVMIRRIRND